MPRGDEAEQVRQAVQREPKVAREIERIAAVEDVKPAVLYRRAVREFVERWVAKFTAKNKELENGTTTPD